MYTYMAGSNDNSVGELIKSAMESISCIREGASAVPIPNPSSNRWGQTEQSEITRLFPAFRPASEARLLPAATRTNNPAHFRPSPKCRREVKVHGLFKKKNVQQEQYLNILGYYYFKIKLLTAFHGKLYLV